MIDSLSIAVHALVSCVSMSFSVDKTLHPRKVNLSTSFREVLSSVEMSPVWLKHVYSVLWILTWRPMPVAACSKLCSSVSAWLSVYARIAMSSGVLFLFLFLTYIVCQQYPWSTISLVNNILVLWSFCSSSSLIHCKNVLEIFTKGIAQVFIPLIFLLQRLVSKRFCSSGVVFSYFFISSQLVWWCPLPIFLSTCNHFSSPSTLILFYSKVLFLPRFSFFTFHYQHSTLSTSISIPGCIFS